MRSDGGAPAAGDAGGVEAPRACAPAAAAGADERICFCMHVHRSTLLAAIRAGARTVDALSAATRAGQGCATCRPDLQGLIDAEAARQNGPPGAAR